MSVQVFCPKCDRSCRIKEELLGRRVRCPGCQEIFKAEEVPLADVDDPEELPEFTPPPPQAEGETPRPAKKTETRKSEPARAESRKPEASKPAKKDTSLVRPGEIANPFDERASLASAAPVDSSLFDFDYDDAPPPPKKKSDSNRLTDEAAEDDEDRKPSPRDRDESEDRRADDQISARGDEDDVDDEGDRQRKPSKKDEPDADDERDDEHERSRQDDDEARPERTDHARRTHKDPPDTEYAWNGKSEPPNKLPSKAEVVLPAEVKEKPATRDRGNPEPDSPFNFGGEEEPPASAAAKGGKGSRHDENEEPPRPAKPKRPTEKKTAPPNDDAAFLGLQNQDEPAAAPAEPAKPKKKPSKRLYFHARQSGFWSEARLFRVFIQEEELAFVSAASGKDVPAMEQAIVAKSLDDCERKIKNKLLDLDELPVDELMESDRNSFRAPADKIISASLDAPGRKLLGKSASAVFRFEHKSKGEMSFELPTDDDVDDALDFLPDLIDKLLEVNIRWDKAKKSFVAR